MVFQTETTWRTRSLKFEFYFYWCRSSVFFHKNKKIIVYSSFNSRIIDTIIYQIYYLKYLCCISSIGYKKLSEVEQTFNLAQLGLDTFLAPRVQEAIRQQLNVVVDIEELRTLTFPALRSKIIELLAWNTVHIILL
jgi:hypothetical protein